MEIIIIIVLVLLNGVFSMSEMALVSSRKFKLEQSSKKGNSGAKIALKLSDNPTKFLSTVQIGITLIGILLGVYSGENLTSEIQIYIAKFSVFQNISHQVSTILVVVFITYLSIVLGELLPKRIGMTFPESIIIILSKPMWIISLITSPFVALLTISNNFILRILGIKNDKENSVSEAEIRSIVKESAKGGEIQAIEQDIVERVFELGDRKVNSLYTHRKKIVSFKLSDDWNTVSNKIKKAKHSAYPVLKNDNLDELAGIVLIKDLFEGQSNDNFDLKNYILQPLYIHENTFAYDALKLFKEHKLHYGIVLDEYGVVQGIITMDDVLDALLGDATEKDQLKLSINKRDDGTWLVDGQYKLIEFLNVFELVLSEDTLNNSSTVAGLFIQHYGNIPKIGDKIKIDQWVFEVIDMDSNRIDKILVSPIID